METAIVSLVHEFTCARIGIWGMGQWGEEAYEYKGPWDWQGRLFVAQVIDEEAKNARGD